MKVKFKPRNTFVTVERTEIEEKTAGGIIIPNASESEKPSEGIVVAIGSKVEETEIGAHICYGKYAGNEVLVRGETFFNVLETDIIGEIELEE